MVNIRISSKEKELLERILDKKFDTINFANDYISIKEEFLDEIIEIIGDYFIKEGLDKNSEPTSLGFEIENLQDKFLKHVR